MTRTYLTNIKTKLSRYEGGTGQRGNVIRLPLKTYGELDRSIGTFNLQFVTFLLFYTALTYRERVTRQTRLHSMVHG